MLLLINLNLCIAVPFTFLHTFVIVCHLGAETPLVVCFITRALKIPRSAVCEHHLDCSFGYSATPSAKRLFVAYSCSTDVFHSKRGYLFSRPMGLQYASLLVRRERQPPHEKVFRFRFRSLGHFILRHSYAHWYMPSTVCYIVPCCTYSFLNVYNLRKPGRRLTEQ
jgi:hypothetical protein